MTGLVIKLSPKERILVNGVVLENGSRRSRLSVLTRDAKLLRLRDAIHPEEAKTPVRRVCYKLQLVLSGDQEADVVFHSLIRSMEELSQVFVDDDSRRIIADATKALIAHKHYSCFKTLKNLLPREDRLLSLHGFASGLDAPSDGTTTCQHGIF